MTKGIKKALDERYKKGRQGEELVDWEQSAEPLYQNWISEKTLPALYERKKMAEYFVQQLLQIKEIVEPLIDQQLTGTAAH